jgi:hypothetical protein
MSDTIIGAIIGAAIALAGTGITAFIGYLMWTRSLKYQILKGERDRLDKKFERYLDYYLDCLKKNSIDAPLGAKLAFEFPEPIKNQFSKAIKSGAFSTDDLKTKQEAYFGMAFEMSKILAEHEKEIRKTYELVDSKMAFQVVKDVIQSGLLKW